MTKPNKLAFVFAAIAVVTLLCACPPLKHKIFVRNTSADSVSITMIYKSDGFITKKNIEVRSAHMTDAVNKKTIAKLNEKIISTANGNSISFTMLPSSTAYISDIINSFYMFADKTLIIRHGNESDTMECYYPYKKLKNIKRRSEGSLVYRTILYFDIQ